MDDDLEANDQPYFVQRLKIEGDADERAIKRAYARELKLIDQETDPAGFQELREAYEAALFWLRHAADIRSEEEVDQFDEIDRAARELHLLPAMARAESASAVDAPPIAQSDQDADTLAQVVFAEFEVRSAILENEHDSQAWERELRASLGDARLIHIAARQAFEQRVADLLAAGWRPGHQLLLFTAAKVFEWESDRRRMHALGIAGYTLDFAIEQRAMYDLQSDHDCEMQRVVIARLRDATPPSTKELLNLMPALATVEARFPTWLSLITDADNIARWHELDQCVPSWRRILRMREFNLPFWPVIVVVLALVRIFYSGGDSTVEAKTPQVIAAEHVEQGNRYLDSDDKGQLQQAVLSYDRALREDPDTVAAYGGRAMALVYLSEKQRALADLEKLESLDPSNTMLFRVRGLLAQREKRYRAAIVAYTRSLELHPRNEFTHLQRGYAYRSVGEFDNALNDADRALEYDPGRPWAYLLRARVFMDRKDPVLAKAEAAKALLAVDKHGDSAFKAAGMIHYEIGDREGVVAVMDQALAASPKAGYYLERAWARPFTDFAARRADTEAALRLEPASVWGLRSLVMLELQAKQWDGVIGAVSRALEHASMKGEGQFLKTSRGIGYAKLAEMKKADEDFKAAKLEAKTATDMNNLCYEMAVYDVALQTALANCEASLQMRPDDAHTLDSKAFTLMRMKRYRDALSVYELAVKASTDSADALYGRGLVKYRVGDSNGGQADIKAALALKPEIGANYGRMGLAPRLAGI